MIDSILIIIGLITLIILSILLNYFFILLIIELFKVTARRINGLLRVLYIQSKFTKEEVETMKKILNKYDN